MRKAIIFLLLFIFVPGCGDTAPKDAVVTGPADETFTVDPPGAAPPGALRFVRPILFTVKDSRGRLIPDVELEIIANNGTLVDVHGTLLNPAEPDFFVTRTNDEGAVTLSISVLVPGCGAGTTPISFSASISASTGFTNDIVNLTWTTACSA